MELLMITIRHFIFTANAAALILSASVAHSAPIIDESGIPTSGPVTYGHTTTTHSVITTDTTPITQLPFTKPDYETQHYGQPDAQPNMQNAPSVPYQSNATGAVVSLSPSSIEPQQQNNITFVTGGIGDEEREILNEAKSRYNLHLLSSSKDGAYTGESKLTIADAKGSILVSADAGPIFYAQLPAGKYTLTAQNNGLQKTKQLNIGKSGSSNLHLVW